MDENMKTKPWNQASSALEPIPYSFNSKILEPLKRNHTKIRWYFVCRSSSFFSKTTLDSETNSDLICYETMPTNTRTNAQKTRKFEGLKQ